MKTVLAVLLVLVLLPAIAAADGIKVVEQQNQAPSFLGFVPDRFIVVMKPTTGKVRTQSHVAGVAHVGDAQFDAISDRFQVSSVTKQFAGSELGPNSKTAELARYHKVTIGAGSLDAAMEAYRGLPTVERVEPIGIHAMYATPNDFYYDPYQWHLNAAGDHDIDAPEAWDIEVGNDATIVAILDSGTRYYHPDLGGVNASPSNPGASRGNMWINTAELNGSAGVDDDGNGYTDDWIGYDFIQSTTQCWSGEDCNTQDNDPRDFNGHGTHTSGIFGMMTNDNYGMCGVAGGWGNGTQQVNGNGVRIMALRMGYSYNYLGQEYGVVLMDAAAEAFYYAADNGAKIASCSWGSSNSGGIAAAATYFTSSGGLIFVASGNDGNQTASYLNSRTDCISVSATDQNDAAASFTNYGTWVDISAPGVGIYATYHDHLDPNTNYWAALDGTSMACPMAAGVAALIWSQNPSWTNSQVESQLYSSADNIDAYLSSQYIGKMGVGRINAYNAVNTGPPPAPVAAFVGSPTSGTEPLTVNFTDQSTGSITSWSWTFGDGGTSTAQNPSHQYTSAGSYNVTLTVTGPGGSDGETKNNYITVNPCAPPTAGFVGSPTSGDYPLSVSFTNQSSGASSYSWTFGDGGTSTQPNPGYTYNNAGTYTVTLTVSNACGSDVATRTDYITVTEPQVQRAYVSSETSVYGTVSGDFTGTFSSDDLREGITEVLSTSHPRKTTSQLEHKWELLVPSNTSASFFLEAYRPANSDGDDFTVAYSLDDAVYTDLFTVASATEQQYSAALPGGLSGSVYVRVTDANRSWGNTSLDAVYVDEMYIEYSSQPAPPIADFAGSPASGSAPLTVNFTDLSSGTPTSWSWVFGDGGTSTDQNPSHDYLATGTYTVSLTATNAQGSDIETKVDYITVSEVGSAMHVQEMVVGRRKAGPNYFGTCTVTIQDNLSQSVAGASVDVTATGPTGGNYTGVTLADGTVYFETSGLKKPSGEWCFEVTNVTHASYSYDAGANVVTSACESGPVYAVTDDDPDRLSSPFQSSRIYPNPFNASANITFGLQSDGEVLISVYDVLGRRVRSVASGHFSTGTHTVPFDGTDDAGHVLATGMYFYRISTAEYTETKKMILLK